MATAWRRVITRRRAGGGPSRRSGIGSIRSTIILFLGLPVVGRLRFRGLLPLVVEDDSARFQRSRFGKLELQPLRAFLEEGISAAEDDRGEAEAVLIDQALPSQRCG